MRLAPLLAVAILLATASVAEPVGPPAPPNGEPGDDDPVVYWYEEVAPPIETGNEDWTPLWQRYEDPSSVDCGGRSACQAHGDNRTVEPQ